MHVDRKCAEKRGFEVRGGAVLHALRKTTPVQGPIMFKGGGNIKISI